MSDMDNSIIRLHMEQGGSNAVGLTGIGEKSAVQCEGVSAVVPVEVMLILMAI